MSGETMLPKKLLIITGLSGSGKSSVLHLLEDQGFFTVDNIPVGMLPELIGILSQHPKALENGVAAVVDVRSLDLPDCLPRVIDDLRQKGVNVQILFLEASEDVLLRRYSLTRRRHPLGFMNSLLEGISIERRQLAQFRRIADRVVDTSALSGAQLRAEIFSILARNPAGLQVTVSSFGFKYGMALDADFVLDVRFLVNPYYVETLKPLSGRDKPVQKYIYSDPMTSSFLHQSLELIQNIIPVYHLSGKNYLQIAVGCTGGRHRSVFAAEWLGERLGEIDGVECCVKHRDLERDERGGRKS